MKLTEQILTNPQSAPAPLDNRITLAYGDGIGREIMESTLAILDAAGAGLEYDTIKIGKEMYLEGHASGIS
ncbi:MAG TPA: NADP-dependent isocitrate dehydrogenase, partial [Saprospiraceae bacterium]|nr:NADP-dependent isocitrate dehydrogenase [Saprospiraceae bacterium]